MDHDSTDHPKPARKERRGSQPDVPTQDLTSADVDPATSAAEEDEEDHRLPQQRQTLRLTNRPMGSPQITMIYGGPSRSRPPP